MLPFLIIFQLRNKRLNSWVTLNFNLLVAVYFKVFQRAKEIPYTKTDTFYGICDSSRRKNLSLIAINM